MLPESVLKKKSKEVRFSGIRTILPLWLHFEIVMKIKPYTIPRHRVLSAKVLCFPANDLVYLNTDKMRVDFNSDSYCSM